LEKLTIQLEGLKENVLLVTLFQQVPVIILTPEHAKRLLMALKENVAKFEASFGAIKNTQGPGGGLPMNFGGPAAQA
jgi:hypothetical protein